MKQSGVRRMMASLLAAALCAALLGGAALLAAPAARAEGAAFTVTNSDNTFTVTRSGDTSVSQTVYYRTVALSAFPGQHYTPVSGTLTFAVDETDKTVAVTERTPEGIFQFRASPGSSAKRSYRFEVLDANGIQLAYRDRELAARTIKTLAGSGTYDLKNERTGALYGDAARPVTITDDGYNKTRSTTTATTSTCRWKAPPFTTPPPRPSSRPPAHSCA